MDMTKENKITFKICRDGQSRVKDRIIYSYNKLAMCLAHILCTSMMRKDLI